MKAGFNSAGLAFGASGLSLRGGKVGVDMLMGTEEWMVQWRPQDAPKTHQSFRQTPAGEAVDLTRHWQHANDFGLTLTLCRLKRVPGFTLRATFHNGSAEPVRLRQIVLCDTPGRALRCKLPCEAWKVSGVNAGIEGTLANLGGKDEGSFQDYAAIYRRGGREGLFVAAVGAALADIRIDLRVGPEASLRLASEMTDVIVDPGQSRSSDEALFLDLPYNEAAEVAFRWIAATCGARTHRPPIVGWCSWYDLFTHVTAEHVIKVAGACAAARQRIPMDVIQIDEGYQRHWGDWRCHQTKFPHGWPPVVEAIRSAGAKPGIWIAPLGVHDATGLFREHPDWFQHPLPPHAPTTTNWNGDTVRYLDPTHPQAREFIRQVIRNARAEGFEYFKIDFNVVSPSRFHDPRKTRLEVLRDLYRLYRQEMGEEAFLNACVFSLSRGVVGLADGARIGGDSVATWSWVRRSIAAVGGNAAANGVLFASDPDVSYLAQRPVKHDDPSGESISMDELRTWHGFVGLLGGFVMMSEPMHEARCQQSLAMLEILTPPTPCRGRSLHAGDDLHHGQFGFLAVRPWGDFAAVQLYNPASQKATVELDTSEFGSLGTKFHVWSFWDGKYVGVRKVFAARNLAPRAPMLLRLTPADTQGPVLIGSTLHISMGAAEISDWLWQAGRLAITLTDAGAREGKLFIFSRRRLTLAKAEGCQVDSVTRGAGNVWVISISARQRGAAQAIELTVAQAATAKASAAPATSRPLTTHMEFSGPLELSLPQSGPVGTLRITVTNPGAKAAAGDYRLIVSPAEAVSLGKTDFRCELQAGKSTTLELPVQASPQVTTVAVRLASAQPCSLGKDMKVLQAAMGGLAVAADIAKTWSLPRLTAAADLAGMDEMLGGQSYVPCQSGDRLLAEFHACVAGDALAVQARVMDPAPSPTALAWDGSCVEVFGAMVGQDGVGQVVLQPAARKQPAKAWQSTVTGQSPATDVAMKTTPFKGGYELRAIIPLSRLKVEAGATKFLLEFQVTVVEQDNRCLRAALCGSGQAYCSSSHYARVRLR